MEWGQPHSHGNMKSLMVQPLQVDMEGGLEGPWGGCRAGRIPVVDEEEVAQKLPRANSCLGQAIQLTGTVFVGFPRQRLEAPGPARNSAVPDCGRLRG